MSNPEELFTDFGNKMRIAIQAGLDYLTAKGYYLYYNDQDDVLSFRREKEDENTTLHVVDVQLLEENSDLLKAFVDFIDQLNDGQFKYLITN